jgi:hypothetical protein
MKCLVYECKSEAFTQAVIGYVCDEHVSWIDPAYMSRWWHYTSAILAGLIGSAIISFCIYILVVSKILK